ncbi:class I SAM-dependent methyltransferase [Nostoc sp. NMS4]|uniref:class I SAM-dependent methyltransferase n=1 Tax=Nostoc sp. NMS4 TaxID=2815390 RepID=UPI0025DBC60C|nr:class I SAM-dependent methyltransferase [Nostoc sp. NMS4]
MQKSPPNLNLIHGDASQLPFSDNSFDVVLTVHMIHTVSDWRVFLDNIDRVLNYRGFYLNCQWITPPARREFEGYFRDILSKYEGTKQESQSIDTVIHKIDVEAYLQPKSIDTVIHKIDVEAYLQQKGYVSNYFVAKEWRVSNTVEELLSFFKARAYGLCWRVSDEIFHQVINEFEEFCINHYGSLKTNLSSEAKFEIWVYKII